jgi:hypothetical protein
VSNENEALRESYVATWRKAFAVLLGWSKERADRWAERYREGLGDCYSMLYTQEPLYYVVQMLLHPKLTMRISQKQEDEIFDRLFRALESSVESLPPELMQKAGDAGDLSDLSSLRDWNEKFHAFRNNLVQKNLWLAPSNIETYDWTGAKARVVKILAEYGEELPDWDRPILNPFTGI